MQENILKIAKERSSKEVLRIYEEVQQMESEEKDLNSKRNKHQMDYDLQQQKLDKSRKELEQVISKKLDEISNKKILARKGSCTL